MIVEGQSKASQGESATWTLHLPRTPSPSPLVVLLHGLKGFKDWGFFPLLADQLAGFGMAALRLNASHNGVGGGEDNERFTRLELFRKNRASYELNDVRAVLTEVQQGLIGGGQIATDRLGFFGHSRGGPIAILAANEWNASSAVTWNSVGDLRYSTGLREQFERDGSVRMLNGRTGQEMIMDKSAYLDVEPLPQPLRLEGALRSLGSRLCALHAEDDRTVPSETIEKLCVQGGQRHLIAGSNHAFGARHPMAEVSEALRQAMTITTTHFAEHFDLGRP